MWSPFQNVPGLFTLEQDGNTRMRSMMLAGAALAKAGGPSSTPPSWGAGLGSAIEAGVNGYDKGQENAMRQTLTKEQILKMAEERKQAAQWQALFGVPAPGGAALPGEASMAAPGMTAAPRAAPASASGPLPAAPGLLQPGMPFHNTQGAVPVNEPTPNPPAVAGPGMIPRIPNTRSDVQRAAEGGLPNVIASMPPAMRQMMALAGPVKGKEILATYLGKTPDKPSTTLVSLRGKDGVIRSYRADDPAIDSVLNAGGTMVTTPSADGPAEKKPDNYLLDDGTTVLSADGKTWTDDKGVTQKIPSGAIKLGADTAYDAARTARVSNAARMELQNNPPPAARPPAEEATKKGTGTWSNLQAAVNAVAGGLGADTVLGKDGLFAENEVNRQYLNGIKQQAKTAFVNNPRFPVAEQKNIDGLMPDPSAFWTNPRTEAQKIPILRNMLQEQLAANNEAIAAGGLSKEALGRLTSNNIETKKALRLFGEGSESLDGLGKTAPAKAADPAAAQPKQTGTWKTMLTGDTVRQNGKLYRKKADGTAEEVK